MQEKFIEALDPSSAVDYNSQVYTSLATSIYSGNVNIAQLLLTKTALPIDYAGQTGNTALIFASMWGHVDTVSYLLGSGADVALFNAQGESALSLAMKNGHRDVVLLLRAAGATQ